MILSVADAKLVDSKYSIGDKFILKDSNPEFLEELIYLEDDLFIAEIQGYLLTKANEILYDVKIEITNKSNAHWAFTQIELEENFDFLEDESILRFLTL